MSGHREIFLTAYQQGKLKRMSEQLQEDFKGDPQIAAAAPEMLEALLATRYYLSAGLPADGKGDQARLYVTVCRAINMAEGHWMECWCCGNYLPPERSENHDLCEHCEDDQGMEDGP